MRHRHDDRGLKYFSSDMDRNKRQQEVVKALINKINGLMGVANLFSILEIIGQSVQTDISKEDIQQLALAYIGTLPSNITILQTNAYWDMKQSFIIIPDESLQSLRFYLKPEFNQMEYKSLIRDIARGFIILDVLTYSVFLFIFQRAANSIYLCLHSFFSMF